MKPMNRQVYDAICHLVDTNGYSPSLDEIGDVVGLKKTAVQRHVLTLVKDKLITYEPQKTRSIRVLKPLDHTIRLLIAEHGIFAVVKAVEASSHG